jgi:hypothetical protein
MEETPKPIVLKIEGEVYTSSDGINKLMQFYEEASKYKEIQIIIDFYNMRWIDANLTALLHAISYKLVKENKVQFVADFEFLSQNFNVLFRNGWLKDEKYNIEDTQKTTIPSTHFLPSQEKEFVDYIADKLMCHQGMDKMAKPIRIRIQSDLIEIFQNIFKHARTTDPCFICGQFYPLKKYFVLTMVDLGVGFLQPIQEFTAGEIKTDIDAIRWALSGNSTLIKNPGEETGGLGLEGIFQIYTGKDFWGTDLENTIWRGCRPLNQDFRGSLLNLFFNFN